MALIQLGSVDEAIGALMVSLVIKALTLLNPQRLHNTKLSETNHLRVSFSRTQLIQTNQSIVHVIN